MRILFDLQALQSGSRKRGIGRYVASLAKALVAQPKVEVWGLINSAFGIDAAEVRRLVDDILGPGRTLVFHSLPRTWRNDPAQENAVRRAMAEQAYRSFLAGFDFDVLLVGTLFEGFDDEVIVSLTDPDAAYRKFVILYDLIPLLNAEEYLGSDAIHAWYHDRLGELAGADGLLAISESARTEAEAHLDSRKMPVSVIGCAADTRVFHAGSATGRDLAEFGISRPFIMHASAFDPRKNFEGLLRAFALLPKAMRRDHQLVFVGDAKDANRDCLRALQHELGLADDALVFPGFVDDDDLASLYRRCYLFVFPSFHEGFGLPALEAMSCGCPAIGSKTSSVPEVIGRVDALFDPADPSDIARCIETVLRSDNHRAQLVRHALDHAATFSWERVAARTVAAMSGTSGGPPVHRPLSLVAQRIGLDLDFADVSDADIAALSMSLVANEREQYAFHARRSLDNTSDWRIEGPFDSSYSLALLNRETARALDRLGFEVALHSSEGPGDFDPDPKFLAAHNDLAEMNRRSQQREPTPSVTSRLMYPPRVRDLTRPLRALHHYAWEEGGFPAAWVEGFNTSLDFMTTLSSHVEKVMIDNGVTVPMLTSGSGVDHWERVVVDRAFEIETRRGFRFLHVSSCFPRKGVDVLLDAYGQAFSAADDVCLMIKTFANPHNEIVEQLAEARARGPHYPDVELIFADLSDGELKALYEQCDVMVGPSCAEGFGLPFAEAMLSGLPVITTNWGGQLDFCNSGNSWLVDYAFEPARSHFQLWSSPWARPNVAALAKAMRTAHSTKSTVRSQMAARGRDQLLSEHRWDLVAAKLAAAKRFAEHREPAAPPKIGWMSTWGSRCGIATYSRHLVESFGLGVTVFAPSNERETEPVGHPRRSWPLGKTAGDYTRVRDDILRLGLEALVIQFNYNFYDHEALTQLIVDLAARNVSVTLFLHSTADPAEPEHRRFHLRFLHRALSLCDRIVVHAMVDLNRLKAIGLIDNVAIVAHGVLDHPAPSAPLTGSGTFTIASYGFALPNKGLVELVEALAILRADGRDVRLRLVNAEYTDEASRRTISSLTARIKTLGLSPWVEQYHAFLPDAESLALIQSCDLAVFAYQDTGESASGAVRYGMAAQIPVATTPLPIFDDLSGATFGLSGFAPADLADGIGAALDAIASGAPEAASIAETAARWREQHSYPAVARRLGNMITALVNRRRSFKGASESAGWRHVGAHIHQSGSRKL